MIFGDFARNVYRLLQDPNQIVWSNTVLGFHMNDAHRKIGQVLGDETRVAINMLSTTQTYALSTGLSNMGIRRIQQVQIMPENGAEPFFPLQQVPLANIPVTSPNPADPTLYAITASGGTTGNQFSLFVWPLPARTATNAIVIDYENAYEFASSDPMSGTQSSVGLPFPSSFDMVAIRYTAGSMLLERDDGTDRQRGMELINIADAALETLAPIDSTQLYIQNRAFP